MFRINDALFRSIERAMQAVYRPAIEIIMVYGFRLVVIAGRALQLLPTPPIVPPRPKRVLVIYLSPHLGDAVMLMPMLERLREAHPEAKLELAIDSLAAPLFRVLPWIDQIYGVRVSDGVRRRFFAIRGVWRLTRAYLEMMKNLPVNICVMPRWGDDANRAHNLAYLLGTPRRIGWKSKTLQYRDGLLTEKYPDGPWTLDAVRFCRLAALSGLRPVSPENEIASSPARAMKEIAATIEWDGLANRLNVGDRPFAVISPGASHPSRRWPIESWLDLMRWLRQQDLQIVILSGLGDAEVARQLYTSDNEQAVLIAGVTTLIESVTLMSHAALFLGNDSGPGHIAGALGVPTLILMASHEGCRPSGPSSPTRIRPFGPHVVCCQPKHCVSPCDDYCTADAAHCITGISVEQALLKLKGLWQEALQPYVVTSGIGSSASLRSL
jgi:ADP-heptose:LPS heptosyltransferase